APTPVVGVEKLGAGSYTFHCSRHSFMTGTLVVTAPPAAPSSAVSTSGIRSSAAASASADPAAEWPSYGHDAANTRTAAGGPTPGAAPTLKQAWRLDVTDGDFTATPVVVGGTVYIGSNGGVVRALDAATGAVKWSRNVGAQVN